VTATHAQHRQRALTLDSVPVSEAMHRGVVTCRPTVSLQSVARVLAAHRIHAVVVTPDAGGEGWELVSDLDLVAAAAAGDSQGLTAGAIAAAPRVAVGPDDTMARAAQLMREYETHHIVVVGRRDDRPVGIVSTLDVAAAVADL
jgi:CBS domain-containing protein